MPRDDVDRTALAVMVEAVFDDDIPSGVSKGSYHLIHNRCVMSVQQPDAVTATPSRRKGQVDLDSPTDASDRANAEPIKMTAFGERDHGLAHTDTMTELGLRPAEAVSHCAGKAPDPKVAHRHGVHGGARRLSIPYRPVIAREQSDNWYAGSESSAAPAPRSAWVRILRRIDLFATT